VDAIVIYSNSRLGCPNKVEQFSSGSAKQGSSCHYIDSKYLYLVICNV